MGQTYSAPPPERQGRSIEEDPTTTLPSQGSSGPSPNMGQINGGQGMSPTQQNYPTPPGEQPGSLKPDVVGYSPMGGYPGFAPSPIGSYPGFAPNPMGSYPGFVLPPQPPVSNGSRRSSGSSKKSSKQKQKKGEWVRVRGIPPPMESPYPVFMDPDGRTPYYYPLLPPPPGPVMYGLGPGGFYQDDRMAVGFPESSGYPSPFVAPNGTSSTRNSVIISTFPDPQDDQVLRGSHSKAWRKAQQAPTRVDDRSSDAASNLNNNKDTAEDRNRNRSSGKVVGGETIVPPSIREIFVHTDTSPGMLPSQQREAHFVTYIQEEPAPPPSPPAPDAPPSSSSPPSPSSPPTPPPSPPVVQGEEPVIVRVTSSINSEANSRTTDKFIVVGEAEGHVARVFIDNDRSAETVQFPGERVPLAVERTQDTTLGLEQQTATLTLTEHDPVDVVVCHDISDARAAEALKDQLEAAQVSILLGTLSDDVSLEDVANTARAMFNTSVLVVLLSESAAQRRPVRDLVSLATLTDRSVFPVAMGTKKDVMELLSIELKLQLNGRQWKSLGEQGEVTVDELRELTQLVREHTEKLRNHNVIDEDYGQVSSWAVLHHQVLNMNKQRRESKVQIVTRFEGIGNDEDDGDDEEGQSGQEKEETIMSASDFWDQTFPQNVTVPWDKFRSQLRSTYLTEISETLPKPAMPCLMEALREGLVYTDQKGQDQIMRDTFIGFCTDNGCEKDVWQSMVDISRHQQAVTDVFDKASTIRVVAIEGIGSHGSPAVIAGLRELVKDTNPTIRYLATTSLSRCMLPGDELSFAAMMAALDDPHWMVRRAACQGMARLGATQAADRLRRVGRYDRNIHVRSAASSALGQIEAGNPPATNQAPS